MRRAWLVSLLLVVAAHGLRVDEDDLSSTSSDVERRSASAESTRGGDIEHNEVKSSVTAGSWLQKLTQLVQSRLSSAWAFGSDEATQEKLGAAKRQIETLKKELANARGEVATEVGKHHEVATRKVQQAEHRVGAVVAQEARDGTARATNAASKVGEAVGAARRKASSQQSETEHAHDAGTLASHGHSQASQRRKIEDEEAQRRRAEEAAVAAEEAAAFREQKMDIQRIKLAADAERRRAPEALAKGAHAVHTKAPRAAMKETAIKATLPVKLPAAKPAQKLHEASQLEESHLQKLLHEHPAGKQSAPPTKQSAPTKASQLEAVSHVHKQPSAKQSAESIRSSVSAKASAEAVAEATTAKVKSAKSKKAEEAEAKVAADEVASIKKAIQNEAKDHRHSHEPNRT
eukprot:TRINITY_DN112064_c0_g1_i1.p1 TRINITY_DN112064_c0_g1~~TRINITY_DN112064_c0_g1_i1.p1  ORF type:complete len:404 (-),score=139.76 TRINITY_DN112064_c0_g1_i1:31-1242(-)